MNMKKRIKVTVKRAEMTALLFCAAIATSISPVFADRIGDAADKASKGIQQTAMGLVKPLLVIVVVVLGLALLGVGGKRAKEEQKDAIWEKLVGVGLVVAAIPLSVLIFGWF